jgi:hypothetical protein
MTHQVLIGTVAVLWLASLIACAVAFRWSFLSVPRRFTAAVVLSSAALVAGYVGLMHFHFAASRTVNGQTRWRIDSKWFFIATLVFGAATLIYTLWKRKKIAHDA